MMRNKKKNKRNKMKKIKMKRRRVRVINQTIIMTKKIKIKSDLNVCTL